MTRRQRHAIASEPVPDIEPPYAALYLWEWFFELSNTRIECEKRMLYSEVDAWSRLSGNNLTPFEFEFIAAMDTAFVSAFRREIKENKERLDNRNEALAKARGRR